MCGSSKGSSRSSRRSSSREQSDRGSSLQSLYSRNSLRSYSSGYSDAYSGIPLPVEFAANVPLPWGNSRGHRQSGRGSNRDSDCGSDRNSITGSVAGSSRSSNTLGSRLPSSPATSVEVFRDTTEPYPKPNLGPTMDYEPKTYPGLPPEFDRDDMPLGFHPDIPHGKPVELPQGTVIACPGEYYPKIEHVYRKEIRSGVTHLVPEYRLCFYRVTMLDLNSTAKKKRDRRTKKDTENERWLK